MVYNKINTSGNTRSFHTVSPFINIRALIQWNNVHIIIFHKLRAMCSIRVTLVTAKALSHCENQQNNNNNNND